MSNNTSNTTKKTTLFSTEQTFLFMVAGARYGPAQLPAAAAIACIDTSAMSPYAITRRYYERVYSETRTHPMTDFESFALLRYYEGMQQGKDSRSPWKTISAISPFLFGGFYRNSDTLKMIMTNLTRSVHKLPGYENIEMINTEALRALLRRGRPRAHSRARAALPAPPAPPPSAPPLYPPPPAALSHPAYRMARLGAVAARCAAYLRRKGAWGPGTASALISSVNAAASDSGGLIIPAAALCANVMADACRVPQISQEGDFVVACVKPSGDIIVRRTASSLEEAIELMEEEASVSSRRRIVAFQ